MSETGIFLCWSSWRWYRDFALSSLWRKKWWLESLCSYHFLYVFGRMCSVIVPGYHHMFLRHIWDLVSCFFYVWCTLSDVLVAFIGKSWLFCLALVCGLCTVCFGLFILSWCHLQAMFYNCGSSLPSSILLLACRWGMIGLLFGIERSLIHLLVASHAIIMKIWFILFYLFIIWMNWLFQNFATIPVQVKCFSMTIM